MSDQERPSRETYEAGLRDGYRIGPEGIDPAGNPAEYDPELWGDPEYLRGASEGRSQRIDERLASGEPLKWPLT